MPNKKKKNFKTNFKTKGRNDLSWYNNYPELSSGMVGANFIRRKGIKENISTNVNNSVPSVAGLSTELVIPRTKGDAYKTAIHKLFTALRSANTGAVPYNIKQLQAYFHDLRVILAELRSLRRAYAVLPKFDLADKTLPISLFKAMGYDYDTFAENAANLRNELNYMSVQLHTLLPGKNDLLERTCWMFDNVFKDSDDIKAQLYTFKAPATIQLFDGAVNPLASSVAGFTSTANAATTTGSPYTTVITAMRSAVAFVLSQDVFNIIAADLLKCFGTSQIAYFESIPESYSIDYVYSEEVLTQIQNLRCKDGYSISTSFNGNYLESTVQFTAFDTDGVVTVSGAKAYINMFKNNISNLDLLGATRLTWTCTPVSSGFQLDSYGTEIIQNVYFVSSDKPYGDTSTYAYDLYGRVISSFANGAVLGPNVISETMKTISLWAAFDWAPMIQIDSVSYYDSTGTIQQTGVAGFPIWDFNNYAIVEKDQLDTYHDIAVLSLMYNPSLVRNVNLIEIK